MVNISQKCGPGNLAWCHRVYRGFPVVLVEYRLTISNGLKIEDNLYVQCLFRCCAARIYRPLTLTTSQISGLSVNMHWENTWEE